LSIAAAALAGAAAAGWWAFEQGRAAKRPGPAGGEAVAHPEGAPHPRARPTLEPWVVVVAALAIAAVVVAPRLVGFTFLVLPFVFGRRRPRRPPGPQRWEAGPDDIGHDHED
jgi:hypothetical protein